MESAWQTEEGQSQEDMLVCTRITCGRTERSEEDSDLMFVWNCPLVAVANMGSPNPSN